MSATMFGATSIKPLEQPVSRRRDNLATVYQNLLTVIVRLRANRQPINDAQAFRKQMQTALRNAEKEGIAKLYPPEDVRRGTFALVAFRRAAMPQRRAPSRPTFSGLSIGQPSSRVTGASQARGTGVTCANAGEDTIAKRIAR